MRIISEYKDYYDGVMAIDQDRQLVYQRKISEVDQALPKYPSSPCNYTHYYVDRNFQVYTRLVGFCGKVYPVLQLASGKTKHQVFAYTVSEVDEFVKSHYKEQQVKAYFSKEWDNQWSRTERHDRFEEFFEEAKKVEGNYGHVFQKHNAPVWVYDYSKNNKRLILNPPLKPLEFFRIMDPYTAYQELCMFYGGMAQPEKKIPEMSDEIKAEASGHGGKYSFRKPPSK